MSEFEQKMIELFMELNAEMKAQTAQLVRLYEHNMTMWDEQQVTVIKHEMPRSVAREYGWYARSPVVRKPTEGEGPSKPQNAETKA